MASQRWVSYSVARPLEAEKDSRLPGKRVITYAALHLGEIAAREFSFHVSGLAQCHSRPASA